MFDVARIGSRLIDEANGIDRIHTIASRVSLRMPAIVAIFEDIIGRKARYTALPLGGPLRTVSYTHLDVYKRQALSILSLG